MSSSSTLTRFSSRVVRQSFRTASSFSLACFSLSRIEAAPSKSWFLMARSFLALISSISASMSFDLRRAGHRADARARTGFVHHVNGLVRQEAVGDVAVGKLHGGLDGLVGELGLVMLLVFVAQALQNQNRFLDGRRLDFDGLEAAFERGVLLDVFAIFVERGRADALHLAAAESAGLMMLRGVHRAFGRTGADDGVQLVNEQDDVLRAADFVHHRLDALLELAAILGAGDHQRQVERDDALVAQQFRARCPRRFPGPDLRRWRSCPRRLRRAAPDCSWCGGRESG